jgi:ABC-type glycerol-3-phosphate transport system substrate-binding protein
MKLVTRRGFVGIVTAGAAALVAACGGAAPTAVPAKPTEAPKPAGAAATKPAEAPKPAAAAPGSKAGTILQFWLQGGRVWDDFYYKTLLPKYYQDHPGIELQITNLGSWDDLYNKLVTAIAGGTPPDISRNKDFWTPDFASRGASDVLDPYLAKQNDITADKFLKGAWATTQWEGKTVALPLHIFARGIHMNDELFKQAGLADANGKPKAPETWDEYTEYAAKISKPDQNVWGTMLFNYDGNEDAVIHFANFLVMNGGKFIADDYSKFTFNSPEGVEALQFQIDQIQKKACLPSGIPRTQIVESGRVGIWWGGSNNFAELAASAPNLKYTHAQSPKKKTRGGIIRANHQMLYKNSKNKDASWVFLSWHQLPDNAYLYAQTAGYFMPRIELKERPFFTSSDNWKAVGRQVFDPDNQPQPMFPGYPEAAFKVGAQLTEAYLGKKTAVQALTQPEKDATDALKQSKR